MRPSNFRHDMRGAQVVEIRREEYEATKRTILKKIRRRVVLLGIIAGLLAVTSATLAIIIRGYFSSNRKFQEVLGRLSLRDVYLVYALVALVFSLHGFYVDGKWRKLQMDGPRLILHVRVFSALGLGSCAMAAWLGVASLSAFGLIETRYVAASSANIIYFTTLVLVLTHLVISPWLLRTVHRKGSQADRFFGAEFIVDIKRSQSRARNYRIDQHDYEEEEEEEEEDSDEDDRGRSMVAPAAPSPRGGRPQSRQPDDGFGQMTTATVSRPRKAFFDANGNATTARYSQSSPSPRGAGPARPPPTQSTAAQIPFASPVFLLDPEANLAAADFWSLWKQTETTGAFSCTFRNRPARADVQRHLEAQGFRVVAAERKDGVLQAYFYASQLGVADGGIFLGEFVLLFARSFFQATFKCQEHELAADFVAKFNLQELLVVDSDA